MFLWASKDKGSYPNPTVRGYSWFDYSSKNNNDISWFTMMNGETGHSAYLIFSLGPNRLTDNTEWAVAGPVVDGSMTLALDRPEAPNFFYDATNGTLSSGDIARYGGELAGLNR